MAGLNNGTQGSGGDKGPATLAQLNYPTAIALDAAGNIYIVDSGNNLIRMVSNAVITTVAGGGSAYPGDNGPSTSARLGLSAGSGSGGGLAADPAGGIYFADTPEIETWPNQYADYEIEIVQPEFTSVCPKTGLPDFGQLVLRYIPDKVCLELKSYKMYLNAYRNLGIFQENVVNRVLEDVVKAAKPKFATVIGEFAARGGLSTTVTATRRRKSGKR